MQPLLNILVCHQIERYDYLKQLNAAIDPQLEKAKGKVVILIDDSRYKTIGKKRNDLLARATAKYVVFFDDDDIPGPNYIQHLLEAINQDKDCCELIGTITDDGQNPRTFIHSLKYDSWFEKDGVYYRPPNHLNCIRASIAKQFQFPEKNHGEDHVWSMAIQKSGLIKTQHNIEEVIYNYKCRSDEYERLELIELKKNSV